jgi:CBS domain containing-hemolysin-like protein
LREVVRLPCPFGVAAVVIFGLIAIVCDLVPKVIALGEPYRLAKIGARVMGALLPLLDPVARVLQRWSEGVADRLTPARMKAYVPLSEEELETLVQLSAEEGILEATESEIIQEILKLGDKTARDCMTPRVDLFAIPDDLTNEEAMERLRAGRHRRAPVYGETPDDIVVFPESGGALYGAIEPALVCAGDDEGARPAEELHPASPGDGRDRG